MSRTAAMGQAEACFVSRNDPMHDSVPYLRNDLPSETDILHEYFIPMAEFVPFVDGLRQIVREEGANLLNASVRIVHREEIALTYAPDEYVLRAIRPDWLSQYLFARSARREPEPLPGFRSPHCLGPHWMVAAVVHGLDDLFAQFAAFRQRGVHPGEQVPELFQIERRKERRIDVVGHVARQDARNRAGLLMSLGF